MASEYAEITRSNLQKYGTETSHLEIYRSLYADRTHFLFELLQNAEDAGATRLEYVLRHSAIDVLHDGRPFTTDDVSALCQIGQSTKRDDLTQIGKFGFGFKSVFAYTNSPRVFSSDEHFQIRSFIRVSSVPQEELPQGSTTRFVIPFDRPDIAPADAFEEIRRGLRSLDPEILLFLRSVRSVVMRTPRESTLELRRANVRVGDERSVVLDKRTGNRWSPESTWLSFSRNMQADENELQVQIALKTLMTDGQMSIEPLSESRLSVFFPTALETKLGFLIQGPFRTTPARDNVPPEDQWNRRLIAETAELAQAVTTHLAHSDVFLRGGLDALPLREADFPSTSMFRPIFTSVRDLFRKEKVVPIRGGSLAGHQDVWSSRSPELQSLLSSKQMTSLLELDRQQFWLHPGVGERFLSYARSQLDVDDLTFGDFAEWFTEEWAEAQTDAWIARLYGFLADRRALWKPASANEQAGPFRSRPIIRLVTGKHVRPFRRDGGPAAYLPGPVETTFPTISPGVLRRPSARTFLEQLGLVDADVVAEVLDHVIPSYASGDTYSASEHKRHLELIQRALTTDSQSKRRALETLLPKTPFVRSVNAGTGRVDLRCPQEIYIRNPTTRVYFEGNRKAWLLDEDQDAIDWSQLGVDALPRVIRFKPDLSHAEKVELSGGGFTRQFESTDVELDGLDHFLRRSRKSGSERVARAETLWNILVTVTSGEDEDVDDLFSGSFSFFYHYRQTARFPSTLARRLRNAPWLPTPTGRFSRPASLSLNELPLDFVRSQLLAEGLEMRPSLLADAARELGLDPRDVDVIRHFPAEFAAFKRKLLARKAELDKPVPSQIAAPQGSEEISADSERQSSTSRPRRNEAVPRGSPSPGQADARPGPGTPELTRQGQPRGEQHRFVTYVSAYSGGGSDGSPLETRAVEAVGVKAVLDYESRQGRAATVMPPNHPGYDLESRDSTGKVVRYIELKAISKDWGPRGAALSRRQFMTGLEKTQEFWLYLVEGTASNEVKLHCIKDPAGTVESFFFDDGWRALALETDTIRLDSVEADG